MFVWTNAARQAACAYMCIYENDSHYLMYMTIDMPIDMHTNMPMSNIYVKKASDFLGPS